MPDHPDRIAALAREVFLRQAWRHVITESDSTWISQEVDDAGRHPDDPYAGIGQALTKLRARGATDDEITDLVRGMQARLLFDLCYLLEDPGDVEPEFEGVSWALVQVDESGNVLRSIDALHESVLETDPTGREMRPRRR
jgi:hypothetical protein